MRPLRPDWEYRYLGAPYALPGASLVTGIDCWELYRLVQREDFGQLIDDFGALYHGENPKQRARDAIAGKLPGWRQTDWEEGAGVLFRFAGIAAHIGIATSQPGLLLHSHHAAGVSLLDLEQSPPWKARFDGCYVPAERCLS